MNPRALAFGSFALALSCQGTLAPSGQLVVFVDTDAPVPDGDLRRGLSPAPLFDRVRIEGVLPDGRACDCTREFDLTTEMLEKGRVSFGVVGPVAQDAHVRIKMFRAAANPLGEPPADGTIDITFALPPVGTEGVVEATARLSVADVGNPLGRDVPRQMVMGRPSPSLVGTWEGARRTPCTSPTRTGEACVPGGAYWMGNPSAAPLDTAGNKQRIVVMAPFFVDATEVTVAQYRRFGTARPWSGSTGVSTIDDFCTFTETADRFDDYPVNCVYKSDARDYCIALGKALPTEAQYEYVASALESRPYVWGSDAPTCGDAVVANAGIGLFAGYPGECRLDAHGGPSRVGSGRRDRLTLGGVEVLDLVGNVREYVRDAWSPLDGPCWDRQGIYIDPICEVGSLDAARGADWTALPGEGLASRRYFVPQETFTAQVGFRCVRADQ